MDQTTFSMDRKLIGKRMAVVFAGIIVAMAAGTLIYYLTKGAIFTDDNARSFEVFTYIALAFMIFVVSLVITYVVGVQMNYTDYFRVRRSYAYQIRKQSVILYSPIAAALVCIVKGGAGYMTQSERKPQIMTCILFFVVAYVLYTLIIAAAVTLLLGLSKWMYIIAIGIQPWIFTYFASINKIPVWFGTWNIKTAAILCVGVALLWGCLLKRLKYVCYHVSIY